MAIASIGSRGTLESSANSSTFSITPTANVAAGRCLILHVATRQPSGEVTIGGTAGNDWVFLGDYSHSSGNAHIEAFLCNVQNEITTSDTITVNFGTNIADVCAAMWEFSVGAGKILEPAAAPVTNEVTNANGFGSASFAGLPSQQRLYFRTGAKRANTIATITATSGFTTHGLNGRSRNNASNSIVVRSEHRINTSTGETSNPTFNVSGNTASLFIALDEVDPPAPPSQGLDVARLENSATFYSPSVSQSASSQNLSPSRFDGEQAFFSPSVLRGAVALVAGRLDNSQGFFSPVVAVGPVVLSPTLIENAPAFYAHEVSVANPPPYVDTGYWDFGYAEFDIAAAQALTASRFDNTQTFYGHTVSPGAVALSPTRLDNSQAFYTHTVLRGAVTLTASRFDNANSFYAHTVTPGSVSLSPARLDNTQTFFAPTVGRGPVALTAARFDNASAFYAHTLSPGAVGLTATRFDNAQTFFPHTVTQGGVVLQPSRLDNAQTFFSPTVTQGSAVLQPPRIENANTFYAHSVGRGLSASLYSDPDQFFAASVQPGAVVLSPALFDDFDIFYPAFIGEPAAGGATRSAPFIASMGSMMSR